MFKMKESSHNGNLMRIRNITVTTSQNDRDGRQNKGIWSTDYSWQASSKEGLEQSVQTSHKKQSLDHPGFLILVGPRKTSIDDIFFEN